MSGTKAGRALPTGLRDDLARDLRRIIDGLPVDKPFAYDPAAIADALIEGGWIVPLAIEAEARSRALAEVRERVEGMPDRSGLGDADTSRAAVLALINPDRPAIEEVSRRG